jgi:amidase
MMKPINLSGRPGLLSIALGLSLLLPTTGAAAYQDTPSTALPIQVPQSPIDVALTGADVAQLRTLIDNGTYSSADITAWYLRRIHEIDDHGPRVHAIIATFPDALDQARALDAERAAGRVRGPLHGIPIVIKDNIEVIGPLPTTAGSLALADNITGRDAPIIARLREAGAIILGKANLSEWANIRSSDSTSGWSAVGGLTRNPHDLSRTACGSSAGSGAAIAAFLAPLAVGTETDGSITCPAGSNGVVGFKPTVGLVSRTHIIPISHSQDTAGPMTLSVRDAALMLDAMAGSDPADPATAEADQRRAPSYAAALSTDALRGLRIGIMRDRIGTRADIRALFDRAIELLRGRGAIIVDIADTRTGFTGLGQMEFDILMTELKADMAAYLSSRPAPVDSHRTLADLIAFNRATSAELRWFDQSLFELAETKPGLDDANYLRTRDTARRLAGPDGIDSLRREHGVDLLLGVSNGPAWMIDLVNGDNSAGPSSSQLPAVAGYPHLTVPMGAVEGLPIGLSFIGTAWDDARVLAAGHAYELASRARVRPTYRRALVP